jgi:TonB family protein
MNEAIDRLIAERAGLDAGLPPWVLVSLTAHLVLAALVVVAPLLLPKQPVLNVAEFAVVLPRGGGGTPHVAAPPAPAKPAAPAPAPPPKVLRPPREAPKPDALPEPDSRRRAPRRQEPQTRATPAEPKPTAPPGAGTAASTPGLELGPSGPGVPNGTASGGDWYMAGVTQKIWLVWNQQIKAGFTHPVGVTFTILANGSVEDVHVSQSSGASLLDMAAQRAVLNAAPFGALPREYGTNRKTIQAIFKPTE